MNQENKNAQETGNPQFAVITQFLKDLSFECPRGSVGVDEKAMSMNVNVGISTSVVAEDVYEVVLKIAGDAKVNEETVFIADVSYAGHFIMRNIPEEQKDMLISIEAPNLLFPFARRILMSAIVDAGFRSPQIEPINFAHLYMQAKQQKGQAPEEQKKIEKKD
tara:strand:+ start:1433 stop:1921 length:489 start_codon:yes stop_codon:yes gene_type:complete